jgi:REP element-mobilizing transposase RayT
MPFWRLHYHLVWGTKNRLPLISEEIEPALFSVLAKKAADLGVILHGVNGIADHVHLIVSIPPKLAISTVVKELKGVSSHYLNHSGGMEGTFAWQRGYGALTIGERQLETALEYVKGQKEHHAQATTNSWLERADEDLEEDEPD